MWIDPIQFQLCMITKLPTIWSVMLGVIATNYEHVNLHFYCAPCRSEYAGRTSSDPASGRGPNMGMQPPHHQPVSVCK